MREASQQLESSERNLTEVRTGGEGEGKQSEERRARAHRRQQRAELRVSQEASIVPLFAFFRTVINHFAVTAAQFKMLEN